MNNNYSEIDNIGVSIEYFILIKQLGDELIKYLKSYRQSAQEYTRKLQTLVNNYEKKITRPFENTIIAHIIEITQKITEIISQNIELFNFTIKEIDVKIQEFETILKEKTEKINDLKKTYLDLPKNLVGSYNEVNKTKTTFINSISNTEEIIDKY